MKINNLKIINSNIIYDSISGDTLAIKDGIVYINGSVLVLPERAKPQFSYTVTTDGSSFDPTYLLKELNITDGVYQTAQNSFYFNALTEESAGRLKNNPIVKSIVRNIAKELEPGVFPQNNKWNRDNYGPIYIPQKGKTVALNTSIISLARLGNSPPAAFAIILNLY